MLLSILSEDTYMVNGKTWKVGDPIECGQELAGVAGRTMTINELSNELVDIRGSLRKLREEILQKLSSTEEAFDEKLAEMTWAYEEAQRDWLYYSDCLYRAVQKHVGGQIPIARDPETGKMKIRKHQPGEALNYLRDICGNTVQWPKYDGIVRIAKSLMSPGSDLLFTGDPSKAGYAAVLVNAEFRGDLAERLTSAMIGNFDNIRRYGYPMVLVCQRKSACAVFDVSSPLGTGNRMPPKEAYVQALKRITSVTDKDGHPIDLLGIAMVGTYEHEKGTGRKPSLAVITGEVDKDHESHSIALVEDSSIDVVAKGEGLKTDEAVAKALRAAVGREVKA